MKTRCGSTDYTAPEMYGSSTPYDGQAVDVFALGVILYAMGSGTFPFENAAALAGLEFIIPFGFLEGVASLIRSCFKRVPAERPTAQEILADPWLNSGASS